MSYLLVEDQWKVRQGGWSHCRRHGWGHRSRYWSGYRRSVAAGRCWNSGGRCLEEPQVIASVITGRCNEGPQQTEQQKNDCSSKWMKMNEMLCLFKELWMLGQAALSDCRNSIAKALESPQCDGLAQDRGTSTANTLALSLSCAKPSI